MKLKSIFIYFLICYGIFFPFTISDTQSAESPKILIIITSNGMGSEIPEALLAKYLGKNNYEVVTLDELSPSYQLSEQDIHDAKKGDLFKARKAANSCGANLLFVGSVKSNISSKEIHGMKMNTAYTKLTYKIVDAFSGKIIQRESKQDNSTGRTPEEATDTSLDHIAEDTAKMIAKTLPSVSGSTPQTALVQQTQIPVRSIPEIIILSPAIENGTRGIKLKRQKNIPLIQVEKDMVTIKGQGIDSSGIRSITINDNSIPFDAQGYFSYNARLTAGENRFIVIATNNYGKTAVKDFIIAKQTGRNTDTSIPGIKPVLWGLVIGVSQYDTSSLNLRYADKDAMSLAEFFRTQQGKLFSEVHCKVLVNHQVTRDSIIENISSHLGKAAPNDLILIFIAGHGIKHRQSGSYYFVPANATLENIVSRGMRMSDFEEAVKILSKNTSVKKMIIIIDSCHSGAMEIGSRAVNGSDNLAESLREAEGQYVLAASKGGEVSVEDSGYKIDSKDTGHGAFTYALIEGMQGKANYDQDHYISLNELFQYVAKQVPRLTNGRQHPYFRISGTDMPFIEVKGKR